MLAIPITLIVVIVNIARTKFDNNLLEPCEAGSCMLENKLIHKSKTNAPMYLSSTTINQYANKAAIAGRSSTLVFSKFFNLFLLVKKIIKKAIITSP